MRRNRLVHGLATLLLYPCLALAGTGDKPLVDLKNGSMEEIDAEKGLPTAFSTIGKGPSRW